MSDSVIDCWTLKEKLIHWDRDFSLCKFQEKELSPTRVDPIEVLSTKCIGEGELETYLELNFVTEGVLQDLNFYRELKLVQHFQVLKWYGGPSYVRHFPNDRRMPGLGFGSKRFEVKAKLGRGKELQRHLEKFSS